MRVGVYPYINSYQSLEKIMHMEKIMSSKDPEWKISNDNIPNWFYNMLLSMGFAVLLGFLLILAGSIYL